MGTNVRGNIVTNGLVLYLDAANLVSYPGTGTNWNDLSGNGYNATLTNGPAFSNTNGGNISFDGSNDYGIISNPANVALQALTISMWIYPRTAVQAITTLLDYDHTTPGQAQGWVVQSEDATTNRNYYFAYYNGTNFVGNSFGGGMQITNNIWQQITYTKSTTDNIRGYINGIQIYTLPNTSTNISYLSNRNIGIAQTIYNSFVRYANTSISLIQIYNRVLSQNEILQNYNLTKYRFGL